MRDGDYQDFKKWETEVIRKSLESCWRGDRPPDLSKEMQEIVKIEKRIENKRKVLR